jgi:cytosine/adenosine deaminase-related metal-dependent hydrolase
VLQIATIVPARVMKDDKDYGSIAVGKVADLVIVDGQPATRIRDLRRAGSGDSRILFVLRPRLTSRCWQRRATSGRAAGY